MNEMDILKQRIDHLEGLLNQLIGPDRYRILKDIQLNASHGTKIGLKANEKMGFYGVAPVSQFASPSGRQDVGVNSGVDMKVGATFNGNTGSTYYSVGDIVYALKLLGLIG